MRLWRGFLLLTCFSFVSAAAAQEPSVPQHAIEDWSTRHVVFTGLTPENVSEIANADPRAWSVWLKHGRYSFGRKDKRHRVEGHDRKGLKADWQVPTGGSSGPVTSPAKFGYDVNATPDCANDYVVFPTTNIPTPGVSGTQFTLVGFNNLYTGPGPSGICPSPTVPASVPSVLFAYNTATTTAGKADLAPVISLDGKKIAFVEEDSGFLQYTAFHVLTWKAGEGSLGSPALPGNCSPNNSCLTTVVLSTSGNDTHSNPFVDYGHDTAYVGDGSVLHKITSVFGGTPQDVTTGGWPIAIANSGSPVYDSVSQRIFVVGSTIGSPGTSLFVIDAASATIISSVQLVQFYTLQVDLIVDSSNQTVFTFFADPTNSLSLTVSQFDTSGTPLQKVLGGQLSSFNAFTGAFDHNYFLNPSSGLLYFAGSVNHTASLYSVGFTGSTMNAMPSGPLNLTNTGFSSSPSRLTEIFNPTFATAQDRLFVAIDNNCAPSVGGDGDGCIQSFDISSGFPTGILNSYIVHTGGANPSISSIIVDNVSSLPQASSIYFESNNPPSGFKLTQASLQ